MTHHRSHRTRRLLVASLVALATTLPTLASAFYEASAPTTVAPGQQILVNYAVTGTSPTPAAFPLSDYVGLYVPTSTDGNYLSFVYVPAGQRTGSMTLTAPTTPGTYEIRYQPYSTGFSAASTWTIQVLATPYDLTAPDSATGGVPVSVGFTVPNGAPTPRAFPLQDYVGLYQVGANDGSYLSFVYIPANQRSGSVSITPPTTPGVYELRYQPYVNGFNSVKARQIMIVSPSPYTLSPPASVIGGTTFGVGFGIPPSAPLSLPFPLADYVGLYAPGAPDGMYLGFAYVPPGQTAGTVTLLAPAEEGDYELRYQPYVNGFTGTNSVPIHVSPSPLGPLVTIQGVKLDELGHPDLTALVDPSGPGATCGPWPYDPLTQSKKSTTCNPAVGTFAARTRVSSRGVATLKTRFARGKDVIVSVCTGVTPYECTDHPPESYCRPKQSSTTGKLDVYVPPVPSAYIDMWLAYVPESQAAAYPPCDRGSAPAVLATSAISTGIIGDINGDGWITSTDGVLALRCAAGLEYCDPARADMNCAGGVTVSDGVALLRLASGLEQTVCGVPDPCHNAEVCAGKNCDSVLNICRQPTSCGHCNPPDTCGAGGTPNVCGCHRDNAADCSGRCGTITNHCGDPNVWCGPCCPNPCTPGVCGSRTDNCGHEVYCGKCETDPCPGGRGHFGDRCGGTTGVKCCGFTCGGPPGALACSDRCGRLNEPCCNFDLNAQGQPALCSPGLTCKSSGGLGPFRCLQ